MYSLKKDKQIKEKAKDWEKEKLYLNIEQDLIHEREEIKNKYKTEKKKLTTTKFLTFFLFFSCAIIEIFTIYIIIKVINMGLEADLTPLTMLITAVVALVIGFAVYSLKSSKLNSKGGIIYLIALQEELKNQELLKNNNNKEEIEG